MAITFFYYYSVVDRASIASTPLVVSIHPKANISLWNMKKTAACTSRANIWRISANIRRPSLFFHCTVLIYLFLSFPTISFLCFSNKSIVSPFTTLSLLSFSLTPSFLICNSPLPFLLLHPACCSITTISILWTLLVLSSVPVCSHRHTSMQSSHIHGEKAYLKLAGKKNRFKLIVWCVCVWVCECVCNGMAASYWD